ncbi:hypothetical protein V9T40_010814 [Parthenolecanium corni]|uniref:Uncharacterized protein n=1 Tax=Parthenolecanium corni TaxID=536013 RepID=A0AAN9T4A6_9HEMI
MRNTDIETRDDGSLSPFLADASTFSAPTASTVGAPHHPFPAVRGDPLFRHSDELVAAENQGTFDALLFGSSVACITYRFLGNRPILLRKITSKSTLIDAPPDTPSLSIIPFSVTRQVSHAKKMKRQPTNFVHKALTLKYTASSTIDDGRHSTETINHDFKSIAHDLDKWRTVALPDPLGYQNATLPRPREHISMLQMLHLKYTA